MKRLIIASTFASVVLAGCQMPQEQSEADVNEFRRAIPSMNQLEAPMVTGSTSTALGDPAEIPGHSYDLIIGTNGAVAAIILTLEAVVALEPTAYNSDTNEYVWGPFESDDGVGYAAVYIRDVGDSDDFRYHYAFLRGIDNDVAKLEPVIWGGATPDENNDDHGVGMVIYDFERNYQFELEHNPDGNLDAEPRGRFAALFANGPAEENERDEVAWVVAAYRDFLPEGTTDGAAAASLDYMYGRYIDNTTGEGHTLDFVNWASSMDVSEPADGNAEDLDVLMAFFDEGTGRADATATGGSLGAESVSLVECWDTSINQTYLSIGGIDLSGEPGNCVFETSLRDSDLPTLQSIDAELYSALDQVATTGIPAE